MKFNFFLIIGFFFIFIFSGSVIADYHLPAGILKAQQYNQNLAQEIAQNVSIIIAFLAGLTSIFSPCILPLLPAYFAITFKEKTRITIATCFFFVGFVIAFIIMGFLATILGKTLATLFTNLSWIVSIGGILFILFGLMILLGKGFAGINIHKRIGSDWKGLILSGFLFAIGWSACMGPILSGVLLMTAALQNYITSIFLMLFYALGIFVPLFILSFFYDKLNLQKIPFLSRKIQFTFLNKEYYTTYPNIVSGILFILIGIVFIIYKGTSVINGLDLFGLKQNFYDWQNYFLQHVGTFNFIGGFLLIIFIGVLIYFIKKQLKNSS